jgi:lysine 6-dehydrogenase
MAAVRELGLLDLAPINVKGTKVVPRDVAVAAMSPHLTRPKGKDLVALRVDVEGVSKGAPKRIEFELLDYYDTARGISAMMRTTGYSLSITGQFQACNAAGQPGVYTPDESMPARRYIEALRARNIEIRETVN